MPEPEVGTVMKDGSIFAGISPGTGNLLFVAPKDVAVLMDFNDAAANVERMNRACSFGHDDWRLPTMKELDVIFGNKEKLKGAFNEAGPIFRKVWQKPAPGWYRASDQSSDATAMCLSFNNGDRVAMFKEHLTSVRFVREEKSSDTTSPAPYSTPAYVIARQSRLREQARRRGPLKYKLA